MNPVLIYGFTYIFLIIGTYTSIVFFTPGRYFRFCVSWTALFFIWLGTAVSQIVEKPERHLAYLWAVAFLIVFSLILLLRCQLLTMGIGITSSQKVMTTSQSNIFKAINYLTLIAYSLMSVYLIYFFLN